MNLREDLAGVARQGDAKHGEARPFDADEGRIRVAAASSVCWFSCSNSVMCVRPCAITDCVTAAFVLPPRWLGHLAGCIGP
eukprot:scaffold310006_cov30-Tisochrysis_lutea.AAC.2